MNIERAMKVATWAFDNALYSEDIISYHTCQKIVSKLIYFSDISSSLSEKSLARILYLICNTAMILYQYCLASWFLLFMTPGGFNIIKKLIYSNPIFAMFFYLSFYFRLLIESDIQKFNYISKKLGLPEHQEYKLYNVITKNEYIYKFINSVSYHFGIDTDTNILGEISRSIESIAISVFAVQVQNLPTSFNKLFQVASEKIVIDDLPGINAIEITNIELKAEIQFWAEETYENIEKHKKQIKKERLKTKRQRKLKLQKSVERKTDKGEILCLDDCKERVKTSRGCYCESDCGSLLGMRKNWCYVDPKKCKKGKYLKKFLGKSYDTCDPLKVSSKPVCHTGFKYRNCNKT